VIEALAGIFLLVAPWLYGFAGEIPARNFFVAMAIVIFVVAALTDYSQRVVLPPRAPGDRRHWGTAGPAS
jgi:hypothetical protein